MRSAILECSVVSLIVAIPAAAAGVAWWSSTTTGLAPESMRAELAEDIVREWSPEAAKTYRMSSAEWASRMGPTLAGADMANLERAASAGDVELMNLALHRVLCGQRDLLPHTRAPTHCRFAFHANENPAIRRGFRCGRGRKLRDVAQSTSEAKSASRERSPRFRVICALCAQPLKRSTA